MFDLTDSIRPPFSERLARRFRAGRRACCGLAIGAAIALTFAGDGSSSVAAERWTSLDGSNTVQADFVGLWGDKVVLELPGPRRVSVGLNDLIADSRIQARRLAEEQQARRDQRKQQILAAAKEAAAPAPTPLPTPSAPPAYQPLVPGGGLLAQIEWMDQQEQNGHGILAWFDSLPPNYQSDLERLVRASVAKLDPKGTDQMISSIHAIGDLIVTRQRWLFSHPRLDAMDPNSKETLKSVVLSIGGMVREGLDPEAMKLDEIATRPLRSWLVELDNRVSPYIAAMYDQSDMLGIAPPAYEVKSEKDGKAVVEVTVGQGKQQVALETVGGKWMFADLNAEKWAETIKQWEDTLANVPEGSLMGGALVQMVPMTIQGYLEPAKTAGSAREFHAAMDGWLTQASPMIAQLGNFGLGAGRGRGGMAGSGYGSGYGDEMGADYDMEMQMEMDMGMQMGMEGYEDEMSGMSGSGYDPSMGSGPPRGSGPPSSSGPPGGPGSGRPR